MTSSTRPPYPSDITDGQWKQIEPIIPPESERGRHRRTEMREVVNAINYRWTTGCVWRMLPHDFPPWATVYTYARRWRSDGTLGQIREILLRRATLPVARASGPGKDGQAADTIDGGRSAEPGSACVPLSDQYPVPAA